MPINSKSRTEIEELIVYNQDVLINHYASVRGASFPKNSKIELRYKHLTREVRLDIVDNEGTSQLEITKYFSGCPVLLSAFKSVLYAIKGATTIIK